MNGEMLHDALNSLDNDMLEAVERLRQKKRPGKIWLRWGALAACVCVVMAGALLLRQTPPSTNPGSTADDDRNAPTDPLYGIGEPADPLYGFGAPASYGSGDIAMTSGNKPGVTIPKMGIDVPGNDVAVDMVAFFIYQGRSYVQYQRLEDAGSLAGEYLGTVTGSINEWTSREDYVELTGSIGGRFYGVNGFDPSFMLCMKNDDGSIETFINNNGLTLGKGADLFEDRLHLAGNFTAVEVQSRDGESAETLPEHRLAVVDRFVEALNEADFWYSGDTLEETVLCRLHLRMNNGITVTLLLSEDGFIRFSGLPQICLRVEDGVFEELTRILDKEN